MRVRVFLVATLFCASALGAAYNGPNDPAAYRVPKRLTCMGLENFPNGINLNIPRQSVVGNLVDGLQYLHPEGKVAILVFIFEGVGGADELTFTALRGAVYGANWTKSKGLCDVKTWHSE